MSYLDLPRLVFAGKFQADPSTVNNDPEHFDSAAFRSNYQVPGQGATNGWWNPGGTGAWRFFDCTVRAVAYRDGTRCDDPHLDPVVGLPVTGGGDRTSGKLVDLDPEQQMVSEIWGLRVLVGGSGSGLVFGGDFEVAPFADLWTRFAAGQPDSFFGAYYQSILSDVQWQGFEDSRFVRELRGVARRDLDAPGHPRALSIKFNVDGYDDDPQSPWFTFGRVVGAIGEHTPGQPKRFVPGRRLNPVPQVTPATTPPGQASAINIGMGWLDGRRLTLDLGNSLPTTSVGGPLQDIGHLYVALQPAGQDPVILGEIDYQCPGWYESRAGIAVFDLTAEQAQWAARTPLAILQPTDAPPPLPKWQPLLQENHDGRWVRADQFVFRLDAHATARTRLWATEFGRPLAGQPVALAFDNTSVGQQVKQGPIAGPPVGTPASGLAFQAVGDTGADGTTEVELRGNLEGHPRGYIDGQVYGVTCTLGSTPAPTGSVTNQSDMLNALVWSPYTAPAEPTWLDDVQPIFQQYADLYPVMRRIVDLSNFAACVQKLETLRRVFATPVTDPNYMPVTRDLSGPRRDMLLRWLQRPRYMRCDSKASLLRALQQAVELEHATLPAYLTALYSIRPGANGEVAARIRSVVLEEMLHMGLACNMMIAVGGNPSIDAPGFVPRYPGSLPGGLRAGLVVRLRRCSIAQIRDVFLSIEEPEKTVEAVGGSVEPGDPVDAHAFTIGWFYDEIERAIERLAQQGVIGFGNLDQQVDARIGPHRLYKVGSLDDARRAVREIKRQGEGAGALDPAEHRGGRALAHYYKFNEIVAGSRIVVDEHGYSYTGEPVPFDPDGVYPMMDDPDTSTLPPGSRAWILSRQFNQSYQALLKGLHRAFNGHPDTLGATLGSMYSLELQAQQLMQTPSGRDDGTTAGPSFQLSFPE